MRNLYLKNYKGFQEEIIELEDVNFFVGENSTGKTSILKLINILNNRDFWISSRFNNPEVELGYFEEIKNKNSTDNFFRIGIESSLEEGEKVTIKKILLEFKEQKSIPKLHSLKLNIGDKDVLVKLTTKQIQFREKKANTESFKNWATDFDFPKKHQRIEFLFEKIPAENFPLFLIFGLVESKLSDKDDRRNYSFINDPVLYEKYLWLAPIRAKAKRIYESYETKFSPEGEHIPSLLKELFSNSTKKEGKRILEILNQFGKESNLFDEVLLKNYGSKNASPFEIIIRYKDTEIKLPNVGYGVSQSLPLIVEILSSKEYTFSIQQPEVHLHPKAQAAFGAFIFNAATKDNNTFLIETHSDYTINRFRYCLSKKKKENIKSQILFFERHDNTNSIIQIPILENGSLGSEAPSSYREFFIDEELLMLEL